MVKIRVPATSANMGPGFDSLGVALGLYNHYEIEEIEQGLEIVGCEACYSNENNLVYSSMQRCFNEVNFKPKGIRIRIDSSIPISRGLGSSAACIVGGVAAANELAGGRLSTSEMLEIANSIEGHPDNVAPAMLGGMAVSVQRNGKVYCDRVKLADDIRFCAIIPDFTLSTKEARAVLPRQLSYADAIYNISRSSLLVTALANGNYDLIKFACEDALHQPYRSKLIPGFDVILEKSRELDCLGTFLSGAGPTIMSIVSKQNQSFTRDIQQFADGLPHKWTVMELDVDYRGITIDK